MPTTADINYIEDKNGDVFFPVTHVGAVIDDDNNALNSILAGKQDTLTAGTNVTISNNVISASGAKGDDGVGISSVVQTTESTVSGGTNVITINKTDGTSSTFNVRNGDAVGSATIVQTTGDSTTSVMSQDGTTKALSEAMQKVQVGTSMVFAGRTVTKLSAAQVAAINAAEEITIKWVIKSPTQDSAYRYSCVLSMMPYYFINYSFFQSISVKQNLDPNSKWLGYYVNGDNTTNAKNRMCCNQSVVINRVTGRVRWYENSTLCVDETSNDYKADKFINDDGLIGFESGDTECRFYTIQIYDFDMSWFFEFPNRSTPMSQAWREGEGKDVFSLVKGNFNNYGYQFIDTGHRKGYYGFNGNVTSGGGDNGTNPYYVTFTEGTAVSGTTCVSAGGLWSKSGTWEETFKVVRFPITVSGGVVSIPSPYNYNNNVYSTFKPWVNVYDSNGDLVADQTSIGAGDYTIEYPCGYGGGAMIYYISGGPTVTTRSTVSYKPVCCVVSIDFGLLYDKYLIDNEAGTVYPLWKANGINTLDGLKWAETNKLDAKYSLTKAPILSVYSGSIENVMTYSSYPPSMNGDIVIQNGTIYYGDADARTWKRINNA